MQTGGHSGKKHLAAAVLVLLLAIPLAAMIRALYRIFDAGGERGVMAVAAFFAVLLALVVIGYFWRTRRFSRPGELGAVTLAAVSVLLVSIYLYQASFQIFFPADILIWSETEFVNDIVKLRAGYPLYTAPANNESFIYTPGSQAVTYFLAWLSGNPTSLPVYRMIQLFWTLLAALVALACSLKVMALRDPGREPPSPFLTASLGLPVMFLAAANSITNPFVVNLHNDAAAQLIVIVAYWCLLEYAATRRRIVFAAMALLPAAGFLFKQSLAVWALLYGAWLGLFDERRSLKRAAAFLAGALGLVGACVLGCYLLWGPDFTYWTFTVLAQHPRSVLRSLEHALEAWPYFAGSLLAGLLLIRGKNRKLLFGLWIVGFALLAVETYTSGIAWMRNHMGPGSLIAAVWLYAALARLCIRLPLPRREPPKLEAWLKSGAVLAAVIFLFSGMGFVRIPVKPISDDAYRYVRDIEREFEGVPADKVLLDAGTWIYLRDDVVMKDRSCNIGDRAYAGIADFSGILGRIRSRHYSKILVRDLNSPQFLYDYYSWPEPSGIRSALLKNYRVAGKIRAARQARPPSGLPFYSGEISVLTPKSRDSAEGEPEIQQDRGNH